jgi:hypothetical protein
LRDEVVDARLERCVTAAVARGDQEE